MQDRHHMNSSVWSSLVVLSVALFVSPSLVSRGKSANQNQPPKPYITITRVPPKGAGPDVMEKIAGTASGVDPKQVKVVLFALTNTWYVQPYAASPYTAIGEDGKWEAKTHLGDEYAALLVEASYQAPATTDVLPEISGPVRAITRVPAASKRENSPMSGGSNKLAPRTIQFSAYEWKVKSSDSPVGPGPNYFSNSNNNVEVDAAGRLHLRITKRDGRWYCAEVISTRSFGYGTYKFYLDANLDNLDPRVVLGLFTWSDDAAYSHREIDVEISRWGDVDNKNAQFVVQPYTRPINIVRFQIPQGVAKTVHSFLWKQDSVFCQSLKGFVGSAAEGNSIIQQHTFSQGIPAPGNENARINLWLTTEESTADGKQAEIIISKFEFVPLK
jgi:hypothetical protein